MSGALLGTVDDVDPAQAAVAPVAANSPSGGMLGTVDEAQTPEEHFGTPGQALGTGLEHAASTVSFGLSASVEAAAAKAFNLPGLSAESQRARSEANPGSAIFGDIAGFTTGVGAAGEIATLGKAAAGAAEAAGLANPFLRSAIKVGVEGALLQSGNETAKLLTDAPQTAGSAAIDVGLAGLMGGAFGAAGEGISNIWAARNGAKVTSALDSASEAVNGAAPAAEVSPQSVTGLKENAEAIADSAKRLRVELTPATLSGDKFAQTMEGNLAGRGSSFASVALNRERQAVFTKLEQVAQDTLSESQGKSAAEVGGLIKKNIGDTLLEHLKPIEEGYKAAESELKSVPISDDLKIEAIDPIATHDYVRLDPNSNNIAATVSKQIQSIENVSDLKKVRSLVSAKIQAAYQSGNGAAPETQVLQTAKDALTKMRVSALKAAAEAGSISADALENINGLDAQYAGFQDTLRQLGVEGGLGKANNARGLLAKFRDLSDESFTKRVFDSNDTNTLKFFKDNFPDAFDRARRFKMTEIGEKSIDHSQGANGQFSIAKFLTQARNLSPEAREAVFGPEGLQRIRDVQNVFEAMPGLPNKSGTAYSLAFAKILSPEGIVQNFADTAQYAWLKALPHLSEAAELGGGDNAAKIAAVNFATKTEQGANATAFKTSADYIRAAAKGALALKKGIEGMFDASQAVIPEHLLPNQQRRDKLEKQLSHYADINNAVNVGGQIGHYMPNHGTAVSQISAAAMNFLGALRPKSIQMSPLDKPSMPTRDQTAKYNRALDLAEQPLLILDHVKRGTLLPQDVAFMRTVLPALHDTMVKKITDQMIEKKAKIPYGMRASLSQFMGGNPLDSIMTPQSGQAIIASSANQQMIRQAQAVPKSGKGASAKTLSQINKVNALYATPLEAHQIAHRK